MKYCTHCGKELLDESIMCPSCGTMIAAPATPKEKPKERKPMDKRKVIKTAIIITIALLVIAGGIFGFLMFRNYSRAQALAAQLVGKTYEYKGTDEVTGVYSVCWLSFAADGQYRCEVADFTTEHVQEATGNYSVETSLDGTAKLWVDAFDFAFAIKVNDENIEEFSIGRDTYYPIPRESGYGLADWFEEVLFEKNLEENKKAAIELFASVSYWDTGDSFDNLIPIIFKDYELTCEPLENSNTEFIITVSGHYFFNKVDLPTLTREGELVCRVTIDGLESESVLSIQRDDGIIDAMKLYVILSTYGGYGW